MYGMIWEFWTKNSQTNTDSPESWNILWLLAWTYTLPILCESPYCCKKRQTKPEMNRPLFVAFSSQEEWWTESPALSQFSNQETEPAVHQSEVSAPSLHSTAHKELSSRLLHRTCQFTVNRYLFIDGQSSSVWLFKYHSLKHWAWEPPLNMSWLCQRGGAVSRKCTPKRGVLRGPSPRHATATLVLSSLPSFLPGCGLLEGELWEKELL